MNHLTFSVSSVDGTSTYLAFDPVIDGRSLIERVAEFEQERLWVPAGEYGPPIPAHFRFGAIEEYFSGKPQDAGLANLKKIALLACNCGEVGCWPLYPEVAVQGDQIIWRAFEQPYRRD